MFVFKSSSDWIILFTHKIFKVFRRLIWCLDWFLVNMSPLSTSSEIAAVIFTLNSSENGKADSFKYYFGNADEHFIYMFKTQQSHSLKTVTKHAFRFFNSIRMSSTCGGVSSFQSHLIWSLRFWLVILCVFTRAENISVSVLTATWPNRSSRWQHNVSLIFYKGHLPVWVLRLMQND